MFPPDLAPVWAAVAAAVAALAALFWLVLRALARGLAVDPLDDDLVQRALYPHGNADRIEDE